MSSGSFVNRELHAGVVEPEKVPVLRDHLARELDSGLLAAPDAEEYAQELRATERLRSLREQPLARPEFWGKLLDRVPALTYEVILLSERPITSLL